MHIDTLYEFNEHVCVIKKEYSPITEPCRTCNGTGELTIQETSNKIACDACFGKKETTKMSAGTWAVLQDYEVVGVQIFVKPGMPLHTVYECIPAEGKYDYILAPGRDIFLTKDYAEVECKRRNFPAETPQPVTAAANDALYAASRGNNGRVSVVSEKEEWVKKNAIISLLNTLIDDAKPQDIVPLEKALKSITEWL